jgi:hypothetical protein
MPPAGRPATNEGSHPSRERDESSGASHPLAGPWGWAVGVGEGRAAEAKDREAQAGTEEGATSGSVPTPYLHAHEIVSRPHVGC